MKSLPEIQGVIARFDSLLTPIASRPIDISDPDWVAKLKHIPPALDEVNIRGEVESLLVEVLSVYAQSDDATRAALREMFHHYHAFTWAATLPRVPSPEGFRIQLLLFSLKDQGSDTRDAILWLQDICRRARTAGVELKPILEQVAGISSQVNRFGMGSTRDLVLNALEWAGG